MTFSKLPSILIATLFLTLTAPVSNATVISGKAVGGSSGQAAATAASAKAIADQKVVVSKLQGDYSNIQKTCASYKGKDPAMMNACTAKAATIAAMLKAETAKLTALAAAANKVKSVSTSTVNSNPVVVDNSGISAAEFKKALTRITQLESEVANLKAILKAKGFPIK
jgi:hypothetical protein